MVRIRGGSCPITTTTIDIKGMTCAGCINSVTKALKDVNGVQDANVDLEKDQATVTFDDAQTDVDALKYAVEDAGYDVA